MVWFRLCPRGVWRCRSLAADQALPDFLLYATQQAGQYNMPPSCAETAELLDADFSTAKSFHELKLTTIMD
jgi:hypothetical protein